MTTAGGGLSQDDAQAREDDHACQHVAKREPVEICERNVEHLEKRIARSLVRRVPRDICHRPAHQHGDESVLLDQVRHFVTEPEQLEDE